MKTMFKSLAAALVALAIVPALLAQSTPKRICDNPLITSAADDLYFMVSSACSSTKSIKWSDLQTTSDEAGFLKPGALTCGTGTAGKIQVHTTPIQYCDNSATPTLRYSAYGNSSGNPIGTHSTLSGLTSGDDHTQYTLLAGRSGGQTLIGGTASGNSLTLRSTSNATRGKVIFGNAGTTAYDEVNERFGIGTASPTAELDIDKTSSSTVLIRAQNDSNGTGASSRLQLLNDSGNSLFAIINSSGNTATVGGITVTNWAQLTVSSSTAGLITGTAGSAPVVLITNNTERLRIDANGHLIHKMAAAPTASCTGTGTGASASVIGTDGAFTVTISTGTSPSSSGTCTVTLASTYVTTRAPMVCMLVSGASNWGGNSTLILTTESLTAPIVSWANVASLAAANLTASSSYKFSCLLMGI
jgi:hypothetical protein